MKLRILNKWVKALTSRKYKKGMGQLRRKDGTFCCLGVLGDLYLKETGKEWEVCDLPDGNKSYSIDGCSALLPSSVRKWAGLENIDPMFFDNKGKCHTLSAMNDIGRKFSTIAGYIKKHFQPKGRKTK